MAPWMGAMTYFRIIRRAAHTRSTPAVSVPALTAKDVRYTAKRRPRASSAWVETEAERALMPASAAWLRAATSPLAMV